jgi:hypothetical protein
MQCLNLFKAKDKNCIYILIINNYLTISIVSLSCASSHISTIKITIRFSSRETCLENLGMYLVTVIAKKPHYPMKRGTKFSRKWLTARQIIVTGNTPVYLSKTTM